jgi:small-conductance mechanosensitive channel/CRP-like cAMP-binding protein
MTLSDGFADIVRIDMGSSEVVGLALAVVLVVALRALLPESARVLVRQPIAFLALHLVALGGTYLVHPDARGYRIVSILALLLLLASIARSSVVLLLDVALGRRLKRPLPRIVRDIIQGLVYIGILLTALHSAGVEPGSILTTSALLTAVIALSLQETLGNMVAGLAIQVQRPFDVDDWIQFDTEQKHIGRVIEINWRATKVITLDEVEVIVPNATLAKAPITNFTKPTRASRRSLYVYAGADVPPHHVHRTILEAIEGSFGVLREPAPSVVTNAFVDGNVEYWVRFFTDKFHLRDGVDGAARDRIWYAFGRACIPPAPPNRNIHMEEMTSASRARDEQALADRERALRNVDFLDALTEEQRRGLAARSAMRMYVGGETIVKQGETSAEMFVVESGTVVVAIASAGTWEVEVARLGHGQFFGEMALMTGEPRNASVRASGPCTLLVIDHRAFRSVLEDAPGLAEHISRTIAERHAELEATQAASMRAELAPGSVEERSSLLLVRIRKFFSL